MEKEVYLKIMAIFRRWSTEGTFMENIEKRYVAAQKLYKVDPEFRTLAQKRTLELQR